MAHRLTIAETEGAEQFYGYTVAYELPVGRFGNGNLPEEIAAELEGLGQSDSVPAFLFAPSGELSYTVEQTEHREPGEPRGV